MTFILAMFISLVAFSTAGDACDNVPRMTWADACLKSSSTPSQDNLCGETLQHVPDGAAEVTVYALTAAKAAKASYEATTAAAEPLAQHGWLPFPGSKPAFELCVRQSSVASARMDAVIGDMSKCEFQNTMREYKDTLSALHSCREALMDFPGSPLEANVTADLDVTAVAYGLGALVLGRTERCYTSDRIVRLTSDPINRADESNEFMHSPMTFFTLAMLISLAALFMPSVDACDNVVNMTWADACLKTSSTPELYNLCGETLQHAPDAAQEVTVYALAAAAAAKASYNATAAAANQLLLQGDDMFTEDELAAIHHCRRSCSLAREHMTAVASGMSSCAFQDIIKEYLDALAAVVSCRQALSGFKGSPLEALNAADYSATEVAHDLGALVFDR
ncbi:hypothetical protein EJB05_09848, partial [Eragrostis curvula]